MIIQVWPVQDAKARFSEFLDSCLAEGPQMVTRRGVEAAVLIPVQEWRRLQAAARPSLKVVTRNVADFRALGADVLNPFA